MTTLTELLALVYDERRTLLYDDLPTFCKDLLALLDETPPPAGGVIQALSRKCGLTPARTAQAAALILREWGQELLPRQSFAKSFFYLLPVLFVWSAWYWRPIAPVETPRVVVRPGQSIAPFTPISASQLTMAAGVSSGALTTIEEVRDRYAAAELPPGTALTAAAISNGPLPELSGLSLVSLRVSNLPAPLTAKLPVRVSLVFSPKPSAQETARVIQGVWLLSEQRNGSESRVTVAAPAAVAEDIGKLLGTSDVALLFPR